MEPLDTVEKELNEKQKRLIPYLAAAKSVEAGCAEAGISDVTYYSWCKNSAFRDALQEARDSLVRESMESLKAHIGRAVHELANLLDAPSAETRRKAAVDLVNIFMRWRESEELESRLESIETVILERRLYK